MRINLIYPLLLFFGLSTVGTIISCEYVSDPSMDPERIPEIINDSMLLYLPFNGDGIDLANDNHLTILKNCEFVDDRFGNDSSAIALNGITSLVDIISPIPRTPEELSISFWMKNLSLSSSGGGAYVLCLRQDSHINLIMDVYTFKAQFQYHWQIGADPVFSVESDINPNQWIHVAIRYKKEELIELFIDNVLVKRVTDMNRSDFSYSNGISSAIGCLNRSSSATNYWRGEIDEVRIYEKMLSDLEIEYLFEN